MAPPTRHAAAWIGLGSNLDSPSDQLASAFEALATWPGMRLLARSAKYRSVPVGGPPGQPMFCNACAAVATTMSPLALLDALHSIEQRHHRVRDRRWGPRTLDLDLLAYDEQVIDHERLILPHPRAHERAFVLLPLAAIAPALCLANGWRVADLARGIDAAGVSPW